MFDKTRIKSIVLVFVFVFSLIVLSSVFVGCSPNNQNPNVNTGEFEVPEDTFNAESLRGATPEEAFTLDQSLYRVGQVREGLNSFKKLTEQGKTKLAQDVLEEVGNTGWEIQTLGFHNWPNTIEGSLRMQDYKIKRLEFELAIEKYEKGEIAKETVEQKQRIYNDAKNDMQGFLDSYSIAD